LYFSNNLKIQEFIYWSPTS